MKKRDPEIRWELEIAIYDMSFDYEIIMTSVS